MYISTIYSYSASNIYWLGGYEMRSHYLRFVFLLVSDDDDKLMAYKCSISFSIVILIFYNSLMAARFNKELQNLEKANYIVEKKSEDDNSEWRIHLTGPEQSPFEGGSFVVKFQLTGFPFKAPVVSFETKIYHPNVGEKGEVCQDMLEIGEKWAPVKNIVTIMDKIKSMMLVPNMENPMNPQAAQDLKNGAWAAKAKQWTTNYAK